MSIVDGFDRFEGIGRYTAPKYPQGVEVLVKVGDRSIELLDFKENPITAWAPGNYQTNGKSYPELVIEAAKGETLQPETRELADFFIAMTEAQPASTEPETSGKPRRKWIPQGMFVLGLLGVIALASPWVARKQAERLAIPQMLVNFDAVILDGRQARFESCAPDHLARALRDLASETDAAYLRPQLQRDAPLPALVLPSGAFIVTSEAANTPAAFTKTTHAAALREAEDPATERLFAMLPIRDVFRFLIGDLPDENVMASLKTAWLDAEREYFAAGHADMTQTVNAELYAEFSKLCAIE